MSGEKVNHCRVIYYCGGIRDCKWARSLGELACVFFDAPCCTSARAAAEAVRVEAELVTDGSVKSERVRCLAAVKAEPECPDEMTDEVFETWKREMLDKTTLMYALRLLVRMTKEGIIKRIEETDGTDKVDEMDLMDDMDGRKL